MLNSSLPLKMLFPSSDCAKGLLFSKSEWRNIGSCLHLPTLLLLFEVGPPKISSKVTGRSSLAHMSIKNATFWSTSHASVSIHIHIPWITMSHPGTVEGLEPGFVPPDFFPGITVILPGTDFLGSWDCERQPKQELLATAILI